MKRVFALLALLALCACTATFTPGSTSFVRTIDAPDSWMGNFYSGSGPMGASGGGP
ncbi:hypothetical protein LZ009_01105 [Ramlibacter sp. XY19]|uniref:hypothetical protein n=1 Tax=Ramlibacter paludis TaxID=2908000 RepID=UPI0023DA3EFB|nr:hypothetical protein [Ramlibacter paludis]MCG2591377.1 hypothetical protein [Ramlibacter paludis]